METRYTPAEIADSTIIFNIPLYQRLFEWEKPQIEQLMNDLLDASSKPDEPYYVGLLTTHNNNLVDGQQRFTVLMLMGIAFSLMGDGNKWNKFLQVNDSEIQEKTRLTFFAREKDKKYLIEKIQQIESPNMTISEYKNVRMEQAIKCIVSGNYKCMISVNKDARFSASLISDLQRNKIKERYFQRLFFCFPGGTIYRTI